MKQVLKVKRRDTYDKDKTEGEIEISLFHQDSKYWVKSSVFTQEIAENEYNILMRIQEYDGNSWEFESQYCGVWGFDWSRLIRQ